MEYLKHNKETKQLPLKYKIIAFLMIIIFSFNSLHSINWHTYTTGVNSFHDTSNSCFGFLPSHLKISCEYSCDMGKL